MHTKSQTLFFLLLLTILGACTSGEEVVIPNNPTPQDPTVSTAVLKNYLTRLHIDLLGREPNATELSQYLGQLQATQASLESRKAVVQTVMTQPEYALKRIEVTKAVMLNSMADEEIAGWKALYESEANKPQNAAFRDELLAEAARLGQLLSMEDELRSGRINMAEVHARCLYNFIYDQINMGSENFVIASFKNLLHRAPSDDELVQGVRMVDGFEAIILYQNGYGKQAYIDILTASGHYAEGTVIALYEEHLFRTPSTEEIARFAPDYFADFNYQALQTKILTTDEYIGL